MRKLLRFILILILLLVVVVVVAGIMAPKEMNVTSSIDINAPKEQVWDQMVNFKNVRNWSPWVEKEPSVVIDYTGEDGQPGSTYHWVGKETGEGTMTNKGVENGVMKYELAFVKPFEGMSDGTIKVEDGENGATKATWTFHSEDGFLMRALGYIMGGQKMLQKDFDKGLQNLKAYVESHKIEKPAMTVQEVQFPAHTYAGYKARVAVKDWEKAFGASMDKLIKAAGDRISGAPVSLIYNWDDTKMEGDVFMGAPIGDGKPVDGATMENVPASRAYMVAYVGNPEGSPAAHEAIKKYMASKNEKETLIVEENAVMAPAENDINKWVTNIYYLVK